MSERTAEPAGVGVAGAGYVGLTTAACLAHLGHRVTCVDTDAAKVTALRAGQVPIAEPGLPELVEQGLSDGGLAFTTDLAALREPALVFLCLPTPTGDRGAPDLGAFDDALAQLRGGLRPGCVVVIKSTVPVGTADRVADTLGVSVVSNPEFLREGHAVHDFLHPDRVVVGARDETAARAVAGLYAGLDAPLLHTTPASAELAKYASNAFLAVKASYVNELAELCERLGADVVDVVRTMGLDNRIGSAFLSPGPGWGGSCLPKDTRALLHTAGESGLDFSVLADAVAANARQCDRVVAKVRHAVTGSAEGSLAGLRLGVLGVTFKAGTDDVRESPALAVAERLAAEGAQLTAYDPGAQADLRLEHVHLVDDPLLVAKDAAGIVVLTDWPQFRDLNWAQLGQLAEQATVVDARNLLDPGELGQAGFAYWGLGRR
ncbi:UDP-glucose dehydrogenase family protein [Prauserella muralis]|uniref:UDP-glucose 6-dehydrogenase n=1 Tax=Prauserella muralis TaxID=588067 RepID=A0A2V4B2F2_9PSEU|nr:UDP-glucose/GDP-mannose dehydrogenase family protein [Prauserella muralis]PXY27315.1 UDP-glucose 6-dehydrogenase [Prauserella muralis]TWE23006.1 UDPglucose 6-dehydrogenase [Prauserella muralis]